MFQNITNDVNENEYDEIELNKNENSKKIFKKIFSVQNILLYIISFMVSSVGLFGGIAPFGLAMLAGAYANSIPIGIIYVLTCIGTMIGFGREAFLVYLLMSLFFMAVSLIFRTRIIFKGEEEVKKLGIQLFFTSLVIQIITKIPNGLLVYEIIESLMYAITVSIFYKIFRGCITVIRDFKIKTAFSVEEVLGASLLGAIAICAFGDFSIFGFSLGNILSILIVLILGWNNGILVGATGGLTIGVVLAIIGNGNPTMIAAYAISRNGCRNF